jgi:hypothetical protein
MNDEGDVARRLWAGLEALAKGLPAEGSRIPTVRVTIEGGAVLEVFRAQRVPAAAIAWRVRGFTDEGVRLAAILGTNDGRAMVRTTVSATDTATSVLGGMVIEAAPGDRDIAELSEAIANAIRALMGKDPASA